MDRVTKILGLATVLGGCTAPDGTWLGILQELHGSQLAVPALGDAPLPAGRAQDYGTELADLQTVRDYVLESSAPDVVRPATHDDLDEIWPDPGTLPTDQAVFYGDPNDPDEAGQMFVRLVAGDPGTATLRWVHPAHGQVLDELWLEVAEPARASIEPRGAARWATARDLPLRSVAGTAVAYHVHPLTADGRRLAGPPWPLEVGPDTPTGRHRARVEGLDIDYEVVAPSAIVGLDLRHGSADGEVDEVLVVGIDDRGREVRGLPAVWSAADGDDRGDLLLYAAGTQAQDVTASYAGMQATTTIYASGEGAGVRFSDDISGCSTAPGAPLGLGLACAGLLALRRRRR